MKITQIKKKKKKIQGRKEIYHLSIYGNPLIA